MKDRSRAGARVALLAVSLVTLVSVFAAPGFGLAGKKTYSVAVASASPPPEGDANAFFGGQAVKVAVTLTNSAKSLQALGSANVSIPSAYTALSLDSIVTDPSGKDWSPSTLDGASHLIELRNAGPSNTQALAPGDSLTVTVSVTTECTPLSTRQWPTSAKQSNDYSGTGNDFAPSNTISTGVGVGCPDHVAFTRQPADALAGQPLDPGEGVQAAIEDAANQVVTISSAPIGISLGANPGGGTLFGTTPVNASNGVATFSDLAVDTAGTGYTLIASSSGVADATSTAFDITGVAGKCASSPCGAATGQHATAADTTIGEVSVPVGPCTTQECFVSLDETSGTFCGGACAGNVIVFAPPPNQNGPATLIIQYYKTVFHGNLGRVRIFKLDSGVVTELFDCSSSNPVPCVAARGVVNGNAQFTVSLGAGDPFVGGK